MSTITVEVMFSGLILLAGSGPVVGSHAAIVMDAPRHYGTVFVLDKESVTPSECLDIPGWPGCALWWLSAQFPSDIYFDGVVQGTSQRLVGRHPMPHGQSLMPVLPHDVEDLSWIPSLRELAGGYGLERDCLSGMLSRCGAGPQGRFLIPKGTITNCHLAHREGTSDVVAFGWRGRQTRLQAMGNAFLVRFQLPGDRVSLCRRLESVPKQPSCVDLKPWDGAVRLLVRNDRGSFCDEGSPHDPSVEHDHFEYLYSPLFGLGIGVGRPIPVRYDEVAVTAPNHYLGECEEVLSDIDRFVETLDRKALIAQWTNFLNLASPFSIPPLHGQANTGEVDPIKPGTLLLACPQSFPHSASKCDTSTYP